MLRPERPGLPMLPARIAPHFSVRQPEGDDLMATTFVGIDWADQKHDVCALSARGRILSEFIIPDTVDGFQQLHAYLQTRDQVAIILEKDNGRLVEFLLQNGWPLYWIPPHISAFRRPRRSKSDRGDALLLAKLLRMEDSECRPVRRDSCLVIELKQVVQAHQKMQVEQHRLKLKLRAVVKAYYPALLDIFARLASPLCLTFLEHYPTPKQASEASLAELEAFFRAHRYTYMHRVPEKYTRLQQDYVQLMGQSGYEVRALALAAVLKVVTQQVKKLKSRIRELFLQHPDADWWLQFPGLGFLNAGRLLAYIGDNRANFESADHLRAVAGTVPLTRFSGKSKRVLFRKECHRRLRKCFFDLAIKCKPKCAWAREYFDSQIARKHTRARANRALSNRWAGIIWKLWQTREFYDEAVHEANRQRARALTG